MEQGKEVTQKFNVGDSVEVVYTNDPNPAVKETVGTQSFIKEGEDDSYLLENGWWYPANELKLLCPAGVDSPVFNPYVKDTGELTQAELQFLTKLFSEKLSELVYDSDYCKGVISNLWSKCNKEDESTNEVFSLMNVYKGDLRKLKTEYRKLSGIQAKLKRQAGK